MTREPWKQFCDELATLKPSRRLMDLLYAAWSADEKMAQCDCISEAHYYATLVSSGPPEIIGYVESVCVWRRGSDGYAVSGCAVPGWTWRADKLQTFRFCPYCGKPLRLVLSDPAPVSPVEPTPEPETCASECNPYMSRCGAKFCTFEDMAAHEQECKRLVPSEER